jgi:nicotine blue oxidoreductase
VSVAGLVLAAGEGRRFGGPKAVAVLDGERLVDRAARTLREGGCDPVVVVSGAVEVELPGAQVVSNPDWRSGMGSSLRRGLSALRVDVHAVVVLLVDTPFVAPGAVARLLARDGTSPAAVATYGGRRGHPVLLGRDIWPQVSELSVGDVAAKAWLQAHPDQVLEVDCTGLGDPRDIDTAQQLAAAQQPDRAVEDRRGTSSGC